MPSRRRTFTAISALAIALLVGACSGAASRPNGDGTDLVGAPAPVGEDAARDADPGKTGSGAIGSLVDDAKIVRTGSLELEVTGFGEALTKARTAITGLGGYIAASEERHDGDRDFASVTYRIPVDRWDNAVEALRGLAATVLGERTQAIEVTSQLVDFDARIANLRATEQALVAIMAKATKIPDILEVQGQLTTVRSQVEQLTAQRASLADQAAYGTLSVAWSTPAAPVVQTQNAWDPAAEIEKAVAALLSVGQVAATAGIWLLIVGLPLLLAVGMAAAVAWAVARRATRLSAGHGSAPTGA